VVYFGFPFEAITSPVVRESSMFDVLAFFGVIPAPILATPSLQLPQGAVTLSWKAIPGRKYRTQFRTDLGAGAWINLGLVITAASGTASVVDNTGVGLPQRFYRVLMVD
jgi:hypothetical protein